MTYHRGMRRFVSRFLLVSALFMPHVAVAATGTTTSPSPSSAGTRVPAKVWETFTDPKPNDASTVGGVSFNELYYKHIAATPQQPLPAADLAKIFDPSTAGVIRDRHIQLQKDATRYFTEVVLNYQVLLSPPPEEKDTDGSPKNKFFTIADQNAKGEIVFNTSPQEEYLKTRAEAGGWGFFLGVISPAAGVVNSIYSHFSGVKAAIDQFRNGSKSGAQAWAAAQRATTNFEATAAELFKMSKVLQVARGTNTAGFDVVYPDHRETVGFLGLGGSLTYSIGNGLPEGILMPIFNVEKANFQNPAGSPFDCNDPSECAEANLSTLVKNKYKFFAEGGEYREALEAIQGTTRIDTAEPCGKAPGLDITKMFPYALCAMVGTLQGIATTLVSDGINLVMVGAGVPSTATDGAIFSAGVARIPIYSAPVEDVVRSSEVGTLVRTIHGQILGLMNAFVILVLIALALLTITQVQVSTYSLKKYLPALVVSVVLANASFFATLALLETTGALSRVFFDQDTVGLQSASDAANQVGQYEQTFKVFALGEGNEYTIMTSTNSQGDTVVDLGKVLRGLLFGIALLVAAVLLLWLGILFMIRPLILLVISAISGLAFFGAGFPLLNFVWKRWSKLAFNWAFMPVVSLFWIWLGAQFFQVSEGLLGSGLGVIQQVIAFGAGIYCIWLALRTPFSMAGEAKALVDKVDKGVRGGAKGVTGAGLALGRGATQAVVGSERYQATRDRLMQSRAAALGAGLTRQARINSYEAQKARLEKQLESEKDPAKRAKIQKELARMKGQYETAVKKKATDKVGAGFFSKDYAKNAESNAAAIDKLDISDAEKKALKEKQAKNAKLAGNIQNVLPGGLLGIPASLTKAFYAGQAAFDEQAKFFKGAGDRRKQASLNEYRGIAGIANRGRKALEAREEVEKEVIQSAGKVLSEILDGMKADLRAGRLSDVLHSEVAKIRLNDKVADKERALETARATFYEGEAAIATALGTKSLLDVETVAAAKREKGEKDLKKKKGAITTAAAADVSTLYTAMDEVKSADFVEARRLMGNVKNAGQRRQLEQLIARAERSHTDITNAVNADGTIAPADRAAEIEKRWKDKKTDAGYEMLSKAAKNELYGDPDIADAVQKKYTKDRAKELKEIKETIADGDHLGVFGFKGEAKDAMKIINTLSRDNEHLVDSDVSKKLIALRDQVSRGKVFGESAEAVNGDLTKMVDFARTASTSTDYSPEEQARAGRMAAELEEMQRSLIQPLTLITREQDAKQHAAAVSVDKNLANISFEETIVAKPETVYTTPKKAIEKEQKVVDSRQKLITSQRVSTIEKAKTQKAFVDKMNRFYRSNGLGAYDPLDIVVNTATAEVDNPKVTALPADKIDEFMGILGGVFVGGGGKKGKGGGSSQLKIRPEEVSDFATQFGAVPEMKMK